MDKVQVLKQESTAKGGSDADSRPYPMPVDPQEDALEARGYYIQHDLQRDTYVLISRDADGKMTFKDVDNPSEVTLSDLIHPNNIWAGGEFTGPIGVQEVISKPSTGSASPRGRVVHSLASYASVSNLTGAIVFESTATNWFVMSQFDISGYYYEDGPCYRIVAQGYRQETQWSRMGKLSMGSFDVPIRFAINSAGKSCIILGNTDTFWNYPHVFLKAMFHFAGETVLDEMAVGWSTSLITSFASGFSWMSDPITPHGRPAFSASRISSSQSVARNGNTTLVFNGTSPTYQGCNILSGYSTSTGIFTVPTEGFWEFSAQYVVSGFTSNLAYISSNIIVNGTVRSARRDGGAHNFPPIYAHIQLGGWFSEGDTVYVRAFCYSPNADTLSMSFSSSGEPSRFWGFLR